MRVVFTERSRARLHEMQSYIAFHNIRAAVQVVDRIVFAAELLADHPLLGAVWRDGPTRALVVPGHRYRIHYIVDEAGGRVVILTVAHTSQMPPEFV